ncbi:MAG: hypothetical protein P8M34_09655, partial [Saprospiraceae bacterium]|nr:hypothetical protein [Saprospiraceae bacterium]
MFTVLCVVGVVLYLPMGEYISQWGESKYSNDGLAKYTEERASVDRGPDVVDGIDVASGMVYDENFK